MPDYPIDLTKMPDKYPETISAGDRSNGPRVHFCWDKPYNFPDDGTMTVRFKVKRREHLVEEGRYEEVVELTELVKVKGDVEFYQDNDETGIALKKLRAEQEKN